MTFNFYKLKYRHKYRHLVVSCRFIELWGNLVSLRMPSHPTHFKLYRPLPLSISRPPRPHPPRTPTYWRWDPRQHLHTILHKR